MTPSDVDRLHEALLDVATILDVEARELRRDWPRRAAALHLLAAKVRGLAEQLPDQTRPHDVSER